MASKKVDRAARKIVEVIEHSWNTQGLSEKQRDRLTKRFIKKLDGK